MPQYPLAAPLFLAAAGACVLVGTLYPPSISVAFGWGAPASFLSLNLVMVAYGGLNIPSILLMSGSALGLLGSACIAGFVSVPACFAVSALPPLVRPILAFSGPALIVLRAGPDDAVLLTWLASAAVGIVPALPPDIKEVVWQPGFISGVLILLCAWFMLRTRGLLVGLGLVHMLLACFSAAMLGPCVHHAIDLDNLSARVSDLGPPFDANPKPWAAMVCAVETVGTLLIVLRIAPRLGAMILLPKMAVATYGHALVEGFDAKFASAYANAYTPTGLSYNWSLGASWECGFFGAGYYLLVYLLITLLPQSRPAAALEAGPKTKTA
eukprot:CAMPEP_0183341124 /NCGR_PEP_ID=MMETSP0164_2-20130417/7431_1 /TAXON_ID=221442 /ORGANISM="Coccolithus pelagicus ssp braarudi, Strain PLY182g" /LENGTH=324 /DNA_ID=CAMNT_0025511359 /DNA_START=8 /DNA_END=982 /DNA_ORIENTATION=-